MATSKVSELTELTSADSNDLFLVADVSAGQSKKITKANLGISDENFTTALKTKLDGIETAADVTDTANVTSAGALMDSEVTNLDQVKAFDSTDYATAAQGTLADSALQSSDIGTSVQAYSSVLAGTTASFTTADETKLDGIEASADVTDTTNVVAALTAGTNITIAADGTISATDTDTGILNVVEDTTPQLGGDLDTNGNDINFGDGDKAVFGASSDLQIYHDGSHSHIDDIGTGDLYIQASDDLIFRNYGTTEDFIRCNSNSTVQLYYDGGEKFQTNSAGVSVFGRATGTQTTDNDGSFDLSASNHFVCTPTANFTLTFTNHTAGQSGTIILINSGGYTVSAASTTKVMGADLLTTITTAGTYVIGYISDGTNTRIYNSGIQQ